MEWYDCDNGQYIVGADGPTFTPDSAGNYFAYVSLNGCGQESACVYIGVASTEELEVLPIVLFPNPATHEITLTGVDQAQLSRTEIIALDGRIVSNEMPCENVLSIVHLVPGIYTLIVYDLEGNRYERRFVKQ